MSDRHGRNAPVVVTAAVLAVLAAGAPSGCASGVLGLPVPTEDPVDDGQPPIDDDTADLSNESPDSIADAPSDSSTDMPANDYCQAVADWAVDWRWFEEQVLVLINARRSEGTDCGSNGSFGPARALAMNGALRCAARNHSRDMAVRNFFDHIDPDGLGPGTRIEAAGYEWSRWGENIAWGQPTPESVVAGWMNSPGHCANIMNPLFTETGVGFHEGDFWTETFGSPP